MRIVFTPNDLSGILVCVIDLLNLKSQCYKCPHMMMLSNGSIFRVTGHLCGSPVNSTHKGQRRWALKFSLICVWINGWVNNGEAGDFSETLSRPLWRHFNEIRSDICIATPQFRLLHTNYRHTRNAICMTIISHGPLGILHAFSCHNVITCCITSRYHPLLMLMKQFAISLTAGMGK